MARDGHALFIGQAAKQRPVNLCERWQVNWGIDFGRWAGVPAMLAAVGLAVGMLSATAALSQGGQEATGQGTETSSFVVAQAAAGRENPAGRTRSEWADKLNANTVSVISGNPNGAYLFLAYDLSAVLDDGDNMRILPVIGKGAYGNARDVLHLKGIDLGFSTTDVLKHLIETDELGGNIANRVVYISKLFNQEMHVLAGPGVEKLEDLDGKKVNFSDAGSGAQFSTRRVFKALGIAPIEVNMGQADAYELMKKGELAATILTAGKPVGSYRRFKRFEGAKMLPVPYPEALQQDYFPAQLTHEDYPDLIDEGEVIETVANGAVLISFNWKKDTDRYRRVARFVDALFSKIAEFKKPPRHPKWLETNLAIELPFLKRFPRAQELLDEIAAARAAGQTSVNAAAASTGIDPRLAREQAARAAPNDPLEQERLFNKFMDWVRTQDN